LLTLGDRARCWPEIVLDQDLDFAPGEAVPAAQELHPLERQQAIANRLQYVSPHRLVAAVGQDRCIERLGGTLRKGGEDALRLPAYLGSAVLQQSRLAASSTA